jgi:hypothetical protein
MASVHGVAVTPGDDREDVRTPWLPPTAQPPPRPVPGASGADLAALTGAVPTSPPPPAETFRWSRPAPDANQPLGIPQMPTAPVPMASPGAPANMRSRPYRSLQDLSALSGLLFLLAALFLLLAAGANVYLGVKVGPSIIQNDLFRKIDENQWISWAAAGVFAAAAYLVVVAWLHRAYQNQLALGAAETKLPASVLIVMCFMPVLNLVFMTIAVYEIWRNSDLQRNDWAGKVRRTRVPKLVGWVWIAPLLVVAAFVLFGVIVSSQVGPDGITTVKDARTLYAGRVALLVELFVYTLLYRRVFVAVTEQQERAQWHYQMGRGPAFAPPVSAPDQAFPTVPS